MGTKFSETRQIATSYAGEIIAAAEREGNIHVWNLVSKEKVCVCESVFQYGGSRMDISADGNLCAAGAYDRHGIEVYNAASGDLLWERKDLKKVQELNFSKWFGGALVACFADKASHVLDLHTGQTLHKVRGVREFAESPYDDVQLLGKSKTLEITDFKNRNMLHKVHRLSFAVLDCAFSKNCVIVSEAGGYVRCFSVEGAKQLWQYVPEIGSHVTRLEYCEVTDEVLVIQWSYEKGGDKRLVAIDIKTGNIDREDLNIGAPLETAFACRGSLLITTDGRIINTSNGKLIFKLDFP